MVNLSILSLCLVSLRLSTFFLEVGGHYLSHVNISQVVG